MSINPNVHTVFDEALAARQMLERAWSPDTAFQGIVLTAEDVAARGQCGVSSLWFARHLSQGGADAYFTEGLIHLDKLSEPHVWVELRRPSAAALVLDLTSDQYRTINGTRVHVGEYGSGPGTIGAYEPQEYFRYDEVPRRKLLARFAILEANIARLPRRHRKLARASGSA